MTGARPLTAELRFVLSAFAGLALVAGVIAWRRVVTVTQSPSAIPRGSAMRGWISTFGSGCMSMSGPIRRVCVPER